MKRLSTAAILSLAVLVASASARAETVAYRRVALHNVIAQLRSRYGMDVVLKGRLRDQRERPITFDVGDPDTTTTRLQIMNALSDATGVDFQKGFVVSKAARNETLPSVEVDTNAFVIFKSRTVPVRQAIAIVAGSDNATIQIAPNVTGDVTFSSTTLRAAQAAREIAQQTQTVWHAYYALTPDDMMARGRLPLTYYNTTPPAAPPAKTASNPTPDTPGATSPSTDTAQVPFQYVPPMGYGYGGYGNGGYGNSPYGGYSPYGSVTILPGTGGYGPFGGYGGPPITFP